MKVRFGKPKRYYRRKRGNVMNLPNKLTVLRIILVPFYIFFLLMPGIPHHYLIALAIFGIASYTDHLDGKIARKYNLVTNFGKFMDPLADKLLVCSAMICLIGDKLYSWIVIIIIAREFIISGFRLVASDNGVVIAASWWGKFKTTAQMIMIILLIVDLKFAWYQILEYVFIYIALALTVISLIDYLAKNIGVLKENDNK